MELLFIPEVCSPKCWEKFSAALSLYMQPEQCQQSRCGSVGTGYGPFLLSPVLVQLLGLQTGNKGVRGSWDAEESWESQLSFLKKSGAFLRSGSTRMFNCIIQTALSISRWPCWTLEQREGLMRSSQMST